jgi:hypothetical protein
MDDQQRRVIRYGTRELSPGEAIEAATQILVEHHRLKRATPPRFPDAQRAKEEAEVLLNQLAVPERAKVRQRARVRARLHKAARRVDAKRASRAKTGGYYRENP